MKTIEEFREYYKNDILPILEPLEQKRKLIKKKMIRISIAVGIVILLILSLIAGFHYLLSLTGNSDSEILIIVSGASLSIIPMLLLGNPIILIAGLIYIIVLIGLNIKYHSEFKNLVIEPIIRFISNNFEYNPKYEINDKIYEILVSKDPKLKLVFWTISQDYIKMKDQYQNSNLSFCEAKVKYNYYLLFLGFITAVSIHYIVAIAFITVVLILNYLKGFRGLFFSIDFNKAFDGETLIVPNGKRIIERHLQKVDLEDIIFEKYFDVYSNNQIEARYILTPSFMERLNDFIKDAKMNGRFKIIFKDNTMYMQIPYSRPLFEPKVFESLCNLKSAEEYYKDLVFALGIREELHLNLYIWSKQ